MRRGAVVNKPQVGGGGGGPFSKTITIDHTKVGTADSTNFPMLFAGTYSYLKTVGNGGSVQNANGFDVGFYSDAGLTTKLNWEIERYIASTGEVAYWVQIPTLSHTVDTVIYLRYGDASITTDQSNKHGGSNWLGDANWQAVYHLPDGTTLPTNPLDSSVNAYDLSKVNAPTAGAGQIGGGGIFVAASNEYLTTAHAAVTNYPFSMSGWAKLNAATAVEQVICAVVDPTGVQEFWLALQSDTGDANNRFRATAQGTGAGGRYANWTSDTAWHKFTLDAPNSTCSAWTIGLDGSAQTTTAFGSTSVTVAGLSTTQVGAFVYNTSNIYKPFDGALDEIRIANTTRSASWRLAEFNSESSPSTFYTVT